MRLHPPWTAAACTTRTKRWRPYSTRPRSMQVDVQERLHGAEAAAAPSASHAAAAACVTVVVMSLNLLQPHHAPALAEQLSKFPALKRLDVSANPGLQLLPVGMLRIAATLAAFKCDGCSLVLPPQSMFSTPEENPRRIQEVLSKGTSETDLNISAVGLTSIVAHEVAALLPLYPALRRMDISANPGLRLLPVGMLRIAATLEAFKCDGCSLVLPPQSMFSTPEDNPRRIQELLSKGSSEPDLNISAEGLTSIVAPNVFKFLDVVAALLPFYPALKQLDISANPGLSCSGAAVILSALSGKILFAACSELRYFSYC
jgi:hypothetical protein